MTSIRFRILLALLIAGFVPVILILALLQTFSVQALRDSQYDQIEELTVAVAKKIEAYMVGSNADLRGLATNPIVYESIENLGGIEREVALQRKREWFSRIVENYDQFNDIILYTCDGFYVTSKRERDKGYRDGTTWLKKAAGGESVLSPPLVVEEAGLEETPKLEMLYYKPVVGDSEGSPAYVIKASFDFSLIWKALGEARVGTTRFLLVDARRNILFGENNAKVLKTKFDPGFALKASRGEVEDAILVQHTFRPAEDHDLVWTLVGLKSKDDAYDLADEATKHTIVAGLTSMVAAAFISLWLAGRLTSPVTQVSQAARRVAKGQLNTHIPEIGPDEMRQLARDFNQMVNELKEHRGKLESLVQERTSNLRESQEQLSDLMAQLRASYDSTQEAILVVKMDGCVLTANRRFYELFGIDPNFDLGEEALEAKVRACFAEDERFNTHWRHCNDSFSVVEEEEWELVKPKEMVVSVYSAPVKNASDVTFARLWMFRDLTEQRQLENGLRQAQKMEAIGRLAGGVAHDFNNLLTGIIGNLSLVQMDEQTDQKQVEKLVASAKHAGQRAAELVKQLLGFSRQSHLKLQRCQINEIAEEVRDLLVHSIDPGIQIVLELDENLWTICADPNQVQQVMMNMAVNAKDAIGDNKGRMRISTSNLEIDEFHASLVNDATPGDYVRISVEDTGAGMNLEVKSKIFEPFFTTKEQGKGTGLGLATSYGIIQQHGGWISCESQEGVGTIFHIYLPRGVIDDMAVESEKNEEPVQGGTETVLLVDDELVVRMVGEGVLKHHGYKVVPVQDGEEALAKVEELGSEIGVIMLDLTMPKLSGRETFRRLRAGDAPHIPVVVCSGYLVDLDEFARETGARPEGFVQKPYDSSELARTLRRVLDATAANKEIFA